MSGARTLEEAVARSGQPRTVSIQEACKIAGVCRRTIYNWMAAGKLKRRETPGGNPRFYRDDLIRDAQEMASAVRMVTHREVADGRQALAALGSSRLDATSCPKSPMTSGQPVVARAMVVASDPGQNRTDAYHVPSGTT